MSRSERNEHVETHFIHRNCTDCNRLVILIGDLEFELHRPTHCIPLIKNHTELIIDCIDKNELESDDGIEKVPNTLANDIDDKTPKEEWENDLEIQLNCESDGILPKKCNDNNTTSPSKPLAKKRCRKKASQKNAESLAPKKAGPVRNRTTKILTCSQDGCDETFRQQLFLRKHLKTVHGIVEKHFCSICNFAFADKSNLKHHMVTHTDNKRFICSYCGARFHKLTNMTEHMNAHLGVKPYRCEICSKEFGRSNHKRQHMRVTLFAVFCNTKINLLEAKSIESIVTLKPKQKTKFSKKSKETD